MKYVLYELTDDCDIIIKVSIANQSFLEEFMLQHTKDKNYIPNYLVLEFDEHDDLVSVTYYKQGKISKKDVLND
jgi:hypothetical protein